MANEQLTIRISAECKSLEEWNADTKVLPSGQLAIYYDDNNQPFLKIGDGKNSFSNLPDLTININNCYQKDSEEIIIISALQEEDINAQS